jgi:hypothetical protein
MKIFSAFLLVFFLSACDNNNNGRPDHSEDDRNVKEEQEFDRSTPGSSAGTITGDKVEADSSVLDTIRKNDPD